MIRLFLLLILAFPCSRLPGQSISPSLLGSAGAHSSEPSFGTLDWSVGETVVSTFAPTPGTNPILTQGFHQVFVSILTNTHDAEGTTFSPLVYPNPTMEWVNVESTEPVRIRLLSLLGTELIPFGKREGFHTMTFENIPSGTYLLEIARSDNQAGKFIKLQIMH